MANKYVIHYILEEGIPVSADLIYTTERINKIDLSGYFLMSERREYKGVLAIFRKMLKPYKSAKLRNIYGRVNPVEEHLELLVPIEVEEYEEQEVLSGLGFVASDHYISSGDGIITYE